MPFVVFKGERKLTDLVSRAFGADLTAAERTRAVAALERANPQLATIKDIAPGSLILVPRVPGLAAPPAAAREADPVTEGIHELADALSAHRKVLGESLKADEADIAEVKRIVAAPELRDVFSGEPGGAQQLERIAAATKEREEGHDRTRAAIDDLVKVAEELEALADRLR